MSIRTQKFCFAWTRIVAICVALLGQGMEAAGEGAVSLVVATSRDEGPYAGVVSGIRDSLAEGHAGATIEVQSLQTGGVDAMDALRAARLQGGTPLLTVGSVATRAALDAPGGAPVIACMVGDGEGLGDAENATGVLLEFPLETQLQWIQRFVPKSQAIGVLYNPAENREQIKKAKRVADRLGLRLIPREVRRPQDLPDALRSLAREADMLWAVTDRTVLSRQTAQAILLFSFRNRMPFSGLSSSWVKAGALYALDRDYEDLGAQCAEMAIKVLRGERASDLPPSRPRKVVYVLNLRTAEHLKLNLSPDLVDGAAEVFR
jgi:putative ABC transport system substrate-binding protein